jgi:hypothetical protein
MKSLFLFLLLFAASPTITMPDTNLTPGDVNPALTKDKLCDKSFHTATVRAVTESEKRQVFEEYGVKCIPVTAHEGNFPKCGTFEIDHLVSLELGGSNDIKNLWPQPVDSPGVIGFHTKDKVENAAHRAVCNGTITLKQAQYGIAHDWYQLDKKLGTIQ